VTIQFNSIQFNSIQFNSIQFNSIQFNSIQFNSIQFNSTKEIIFNSHQANFERFTPSKQKFLPSSASSVSGEVRNKLSAENKVTSAVKSYAMRMPS